MSFSSNSTWLSVAVAAILLSLGAIEAGLLVWMWWKKKRGGWRFFRCSCRKDLLGWVICLRDIGMCRGVEDEAMRRKIEILADAQRLERIRNALHIFLAAIPVLLFRSISTAYYLSIADDNEFLAHRASLIFYLPVEIGAIAFLLKPGTLTKSAVRLVYASVMVRRIYVALAYDAEGDLGELSEVPRVFETVLDHSVRLWLGLMLQDAPFVLLLHLLLVPVTLSIYIVSVHEDYLMACLGEVLMALIVCLTCVTMERANKASIHDSLRAESARAFEGAADVLLSSMCDAVVHLTGSFELRKECPRLAVVLLRDPSEPLKGTDFCDHLMSEEDREAFTSFVTEDGSDRLARTLHVTLRDANNMAVLAQLFHTKCFGMGPEDTHIVGIRDVGGERHAPLSEHPETNTISKAYSLERRQGMLMPIIEDSTLESDTSDTESGSVGWPSNVFEDKVKVWISTIDIALPLVRWTPGFLNLVGPSSVFVGSNFLDFVGVESEQESFIRELQALYNQILHNEEMAGADVKFVLATAHFGDVAVDAEVDLEYEVEAEALGKDDDISLVIEFKSWTRVKRRRGAKRSKQRSISTKGSSSTAPPAA